MDVHLVAEDPIREAVTVALGDAEVGTVESTPDDLDEARFAVVSAVVGSEAFEVANEAALSGGTPWIAVEVGGVGGRGVEGVDAAITGFAPGSETACFRCLETRVDAASGESAGGTGRAADGAVSADRAAARLAGAAVGRECLRLFSGEDRTVVGHTIELPHRRRRLLPVPGCRCDAGRDRALDLDDEERLSLSVAVERSEAAIDERLGILTEIGELASFPAPYYLARSAPTEGFSDASAPTEAAGVDPDWNAALMKAVGEALERYCAGVYRDEDFVVGSADDIAATGRNVVEPTAVVRSDDAPAYDPSDELRWVAGTNLATGESALLPAGAVHFPQPGKKLVPPITTGLGLGSSTADALLAGLTEVLERDATMCSWYSTHEPTPLAVEDDEFATLANRVASEGLVVTPLHVTRDVGVPVVSVAVHRPIDGRDGGAAESDAGWAHEKRSDEWPRFAAGSAAALDAEEAARSALTEAVQNWMELRSIGREDADEAGGAIDEYATFPEEARTFVDVDPDGAVEASSLSVRDENGDVPGGRGALSELVSLTERAGLTPYAARVSTRDVESLGFEAVRVVVPGTQPLFVSEPIFGDRIERVADRTGTEPRLDAPYHPYP